MASETVVHVIPARLAPIEDRTLHHLRNIAHDARRGMTSPAENEFLLATAGPLLDELVAWRNFAAGVMAPEAMVTYLPGRS